MNESDAAPNTPQIRYEGVRWTAPIIADRKVFDEFHRRARLSGPIGLRAIASALGIRPPSTMHTWSIGWAPDPGRGSERLVWYDPNKLGRIDQQISAALQDCPEDGEIVLSQGLGWDEIDVRITAGAEPAASGDTAPTTEADGVVEASGVNARTGGNGPEGLGQDIAGVEYEESER